jgi:hypothetical protein
MLSAHISSSRVCSVLASVPVAYAQCTLPCAYADVLQNEHLKIGKTDAQAQHARKELMHMLGWASVPGAYAQFLMCMLSVRMKVGTYAEGSQYF